MTATHSMPTIMKSRFEFFRQTTTLLVAVLLGQVAVHAGSPPQPVAPAKSPAIAAPASTNVVVEIPQSVFFVTSTTQVIRDPFFPDSVRFKVVTTTKTDVPKGAVAAELVLQGLSGSATRPMATINNRIFESGEEIEVVTPSGKVRVRCVEINLKDETVIIEVGGSRRELRFSRRK